MLMNSSQLICDLFGKERKLKANLIIKISNKVSSIVIKIFVQQTSSNKRRFGTKHCLHVGSTGSRAVNYFGQLHA